MTKLHAEKPAQCITGLAFFGFGIGTLIFMFGIGPLVQLILPRFEMRLASDQRQ